MECRNKNHQEYIYTEIALTRTVCFAYKTNISLGSFGTSYDSSFHKTQNSIPQK